MPPRTAASAFLWAAVIGFCIWGVSRARALAGWHGEARHRGECTRQWASRCEGQCERHACGRVIAARSHVPRENSRFWQSGIRQNRRPDADFWLGSVSSRIAAQL